MHNIPTDNCVEQLTKALSEITDLTVLDTPNPGFLPFTRVKYRPDFNLLVRFAAIPHPLTLLIEEKVNLYPRDVLRLLGILEPSLDNLSPGELFVVVAQYISHSAKHLLQKSHINFYETASGTLYFKYETLHFDIQRSNSTAPESPSEVQLFKGAREQVIHALLTHRLNAGKDSWQSGTELVHFAKTSAFTVSTTMKELEQQGIVETRGSGPSQQRRLIEPDTLLDKWAVAWSKRMLKEKRSNWYVYLKNSNDIFNYAKRLLKDSNCLLTGAAVANQISPHLTDIERITIIANEEDQDLLYQYLKQEAERVDKGYNFSIVYRNGASLMFKKQMGLDCATASDFVIYLDLLDGIGRNKELAAEYRNRCLNFNEIHAKW